MKSQKLTIPLFIFYLLALSWIILLKTRFSFAFLHTGRSLNLVPFGAMQILHDLPNYHEIINNGLVFIPMGVFLCMLSMKKSLMHLVVPIISLSLLFEVIQYIFAIGASDITDVIANTFGGMIGTGVFYVLQRIYKDNVNKVIHVIALVLAFILVLWIGLISLLQ